MRLTCHAYGACCHSLESTAGGSREGWKAADERAIFHPGNLLIAWAGDCESLDYVQPASTNKNQEKTK